MHEALKTLERERERNKRGEKSELMDLLIARKWLDMFGPFQKHPRDAARNRPIPQNQQKHSTEQVSAIRFYTKEEFKKGGRE